MPVLFPPATGRVLIQFSSGECHGTVLSTGRSQRDGWRFLRLVNVTDNATTQDPTHHWPVGSPGANAILAVLRRSALPRLTAHPAQLHQSAAFWQKQKAGLQSRTRTERNAENRKVPSCFSFHDPRFIIAFPAYPPWLLAVRRSRASATPALSDSRTALLASLKF